LSLNTKLRRCGGAA